ncbi:hypothetical protein [Legionella anisa]|uniref:hypothetical protein n=1 Tax=Legionella anisa TaxID=28082 RepID=UPI0010410302|nr:hypothetical protein [Legionella anisa]
MFLASQSQIEPLFAPGDTKANGLRINLRWHGTQSFRWPMPLGKNNEGIGQCCHSDYSHIWDEHGNDRKLCRNKRRTSLLLQCHALSLHELDARVRRVGQAFF